jgi:hypothetical protein
MTVKPYQISEMPHAFLIIQRRQSVNQDLHSPRHLLHRTNENEPFYATVASFPSLAGLAAPLSDFAILSSLLSSARTSFCATGES